VLLKQLMVDISMRIIELGASRQIPLPIPLPRRFFRTKFRCVGYRDNATKALILRDFMTLAGQSCMP
jgi:hypothetical protein